MWLKRIRDYTTAKKVARGVCYYNHVSIGSRQVLQWPHYAILVNGHRAGWIGYRRSRSGSYEVAHLSVLPGSRRRGLAESAVRQILYKIRALGGHYAFARIRRYNRPSMGLFRKIGFRKTKGGRVFRFARRV